MYVKVSTPSQLGCPSCLIFHVQLCLKSLHHLFPKSFLCSNYFWTIAFHSRERLTKTWEINRSYKAQKVSNSQVSGGSWKLQDSQSPCPVLESNNNYWEMRLSNWLSYSTSVWTSFRESQGCGFCKSSSVLSELLMIQLPKSCPCSYTNPRLCSISKAHKLSGSPSWALIELFLCSIISALAGMNQTVAHVYKGKANMICQVYLETKFHLPTVKSE